MTISSTVTKAIYGGNGSTTAFAVPFVFANKEDVEVMITDMEGVESMLTLSTDYTLSGEGQPSGGTCTLATTPEAGQTLVIRRNPTIVQEVDYVENDPFPAATHEAALDKLTMVCQTLSERLDRTVSFRVSSSTPGKDMPEPEAGRAIVWNETGNELSNGPTVNEISNAQTYAQNAATSETNAAASLQGAAEARAGAEAAQAATESARDTAIANISTQEIASINAVAAEGTDQVAAVNAAGTTQVNSITAQGNAQDARVTTEGDSQVALVLAAGANACTGAEAARDAAVSAQLAAEAARDTATDIASGAHNGLTSRDTADAHPTSAITGLDAALNAKADQTSVDTALAGKLDSTAQAADSAQLAGLSPAITPTADTIVQRNNLGDIESRAITSDWFRTLGAPTERTNDPYFATIASGWIYPNTKSGTQSSLGLRPGIDIARMSDLPADKGVWEYVNTINITAAVSSIEITGLANHSYEYFVNITGLYYIGTAGALVIEMGYGATPTWLSGNVYRSAWGTATIAYLQQGNMGGPISSNFLLRHSNTTQPSVVDSFTSSTDSSGYRQAVEYSHQHDTYSEITGLKLYNNKGGQASKGVVKIWRRNAR